MTRKRKAILFFTGFAIAAAIFLWLRRDKRDVRYEVIYPTGLPSTESAVLGEYGEIAVSDMSDPNTAFLIWKPEEGATKIKAPVFEGFHGHIKWVPVDMNRHGQIVGHYDVEYNPLGFLWSPEEGFTSVGDFGSGLHEANAINDKGMVVGVTTTDTGKIHAFLWEKEKGTTDLTPNTEMSNADDINNNGQVVGKIITSDYFRVFIWEKSKSITTLDFDGYEFCNALAINDSGQVIGWIIDSNGDGDLFTWDKENGVKILNVGTQRAHFTNSNQIAYTDVTDEFSIGIRNFTLFYSCEYMPYLGNTNGEFILLYKYVPRNIDDICILDMNDRGDILVTDSYGQLALLRPIQKAK
ncbi:MAG: hypothetical protein JXA82_03075 [Sedimentisphaerales bacterium]|nr:hypothetical protein [Sedimentisphaerales bacterium]